MAYIYLTTPASQGALVDWLASPVVMSILLMIGLIGLIVELVAPGGFLPGLIGFAAFATYFIGQYLAGFASWDAPLLFIAGAILILIELVVPGFGIFGIIGTLVLFYSVIVAASSVKVGLISLLIGILGTAIFVWILYKFFGFRATWSRMVLGGAQENREGYTTSKTRKTLLGKEGITLTPLRPSGWALFDSKREDVVSEGEMIPKDTKIVVIYVEGTRVVVRKVEEDN